MVALLHANYVPPGDSPAVLVVNGAGVWFAGNAQPPDDLRPWIPLSGEGFDVFVVRVWLLAREILVVLPTVANPTLSVVGGRPRGYLQAKACVSLSSWPIN
jgi:hypothetical protein